MYACTSVLYKLKPKYGPRGSAEQTLYFHTTTIKVWTWNGEGYGGLEVNSEWIKKIIDVRMEGI